MSKRWTNLSSKAKVQQKWASSFLVAPWIWKPVPLLVTQTLVSRTLNTRSRSVVWFVVSRTLLNCWKLDDLTWARSSVGKAPPPKRVVRSTLAAEVSAFVDRIAHVSELSEGRREGEFKEASNCVHWQRQPGKHSQERCWTKPRQEVQNRCVHAPRRIQRSWEYITAVVADTLASCGSFDEDHGKGHPRLILQQSCISTCGQENLCKQNSHRKCLMLPRNEFQLLLTRIWCHYSRFCLFTVNICDPSLVDFFCPVQHSRISFFGCFICSSLYNANCWELLRSFVKCRLPPRVDVDEAPYAPGNYLLYVTELEDAHDPIKLLKSDDNLEFFITETLPMPDSNGTSGQCNKTCMDDTHSAQPIAGIITCQFENEIPLVRKSSSRTQQCSASGWSWMNLRLLQSLLDERYFQVFSLVSQICQTRALLEVWITPLSRIAWGGVLFVSPTWAHFARFVPCVSLCVCLHACTQQFTDHQHRLTCMHRRRLDQTAFGFAFVKTCVAHVPDIVIEYMRIPQQRQKSTKQTTQDRSGRTRRRLQKHRSTAFETKRTCTSQSGTVSS